MRISIRLLAAAFALIAPLLRSLAAPAAARTQGESCRSVREALNANEITLSLAANQNMFYDEPLDYSVTNIAGAIVEFCFPAGMIMLAGDGGYQDLILTRTIAIVLGPGEQKSGTLSAACANLSKHAPATGTSFSLGGMADGDLLRLAQAIERRNAQGRLGAQIAIWAVTDGFSLEEINSGSDSEASESFRLIAPVLCLTQDELILAQDLLTEAGTDARIFEGDPQNAMEFCKRMGLPTDVNQLMVLVGEYSLAAFCCCGLCCGLVLIVLAGGIFLIVRARKR